MANSTEKYNEGIKTWNSLSSNGITGHLLELLKLIGGLAGNLGNLAKLVK